MKPRVWRASAAGLKPATAAADVPGGNARVPGRSPASGTEAVRLKAKTGREDGRHVFSIYAKLLLLLFLLTLPLLNPWVRGDGVGYYAYARSLLIEHRLHFENDWLKANPTFRMDRVDSGGHLRADQYTPTGHLDNHFSVGPAMLWAPFLITVHLLVVGLNHLGAHIAADGYSRPYLVTMALATAGYGFMGLYLSFCLARNYFQERWAFLGVLGIWFGSSLPVYMYFNPSWSHAHSAFAVALFLWYWHRTRQQRTLGQWALLGALAGLMIDVYYPNGLLLIVPGLEALADYGRAWRDRTRNPARLGRLLATHVVFLFVIGVALLPTFVTRKIIYGTAFQFGSGYTETQDWYWTSPALKQVLFSSNHGLFSWTPILVFAVLGLFFFFRQDKSFAKYLLAAFLVFYYVIASFYFWHGLSSYGNRFFISLTALFVLGLAAFLERFAQLLASRQKAFAAAGLLVGFFVVWNAGFILQWGTHLVPARGPISWPEMVHNQVAVVPQQMTVAIKSYLVRRKALMQQIEQKDLEGLRSEKQKKD